MHTDVKVLFANLWQDYVAVTPSAKKVHQLLGSSQQDDVINDHIALRTFNLEKVGLENWPRILKRWAMKSVVNIILRRKSCMPSTMSTRIAAYQRYLFLSYCWINALLTCVIPSLH